MSALTRHCRSRGISVKDGRSIAPPTRRVPPMTTEARPRRRPALRPRRASFEALEPRQLMAGGLAVVRLLPTGPAAHPFDTIDVRFNGPVLDGGFPLSAVSMLGPGGASVTP